MNDLTMRLENGTAWISMDDGKVNALSESLLGQLSAALKAAEEAQAIVVLSGRQGVFSAGFDMKTFAKGPEPSLRMLRAGADMIQQLLSYPFPVLTVAAGHAYPMGAFLMLSSDVRFAEAGPWRFGMNEVAIGLTVPRFALELARHKLTPPGFARITTAPMFESEEALRFGYIDRVISPDQLDSAVEDEVARFHTLDMEAYAGTKSRVNDAALHAIRRGIELDVAQFAAT